MYNHILTYLVHVFVLNRHGTEDGSVPWTVPAPAEEQRMLLVARLRQWPCADSERVSHTDWQKLLTRTDKSFVLVYPTSLIRHKSKYSRIFPYLQCNLSESQTIIYYVTYIAMLEPMCVCVWPQRTLSFVMCGRWEIEKWLCWALVMFNTMALFWITGLCNHRHIHCFNLKRPHFKHLISNGVCVLGTGRHSWKKNCQPSTN